MRFSLVSVLDPVLPIPPGAGEGGCADAEPPLTHPFRPKLLVEEHP